MCLEGPCGLDWTALTMMTTTARDDDAASVLRHKRTTACRHSSEVHHSARG